MYCGKSKGDKEVLVCFATASAGFFIPFLGEQCEMMKHDGKGGGRVNMSVPPTHCVENTLGLRIQKA